MEDVLKSVCSEIGVGASNHNQLLRVKYLNGKDLTFLREISGRESNASVWKRTQNRNSSRSHSDRRRVDLSRNLQSGMGLLKWLKGQCDSHRKEDLKTRKVSIKFPMGFQTADFEGYLTGDRLQGVGTYRWLGGLLSYKGEISNGMRHGKGILISRDPFIFFKGHFREGLKHGHGLGLLRSGNLFKGSYQGGLRSGCGIMAYATDDFKMILLSQDLNMRSQRKAKRRAKKINHFTAKRSRNSMGSQTLIEKDDALDIEKNLENLIIRIKGEGLDCENDLKGRNFKTGADKWNSQVLAKDGSSFKFSTEKLLKQNVRNVFLGNWKYGVDLGLYD